MHLSRNIKILLLGANLWYFGEGMLGPLFAVYAQRIGGDVLDITWAWATFLIITGVMYIIISKMVSSKIGKARIMVVGYGLNALFTFSYLFVSSPWQLFMVQAGLGVADAFGTPAWESLYAEDHKKENSAYAWGLAGGQAHIFTGIAIIVGGLVVSYFSFKLLFIIMGCVQIIATIVQSRILRRLQ